MVVGIGPSPESKREVNNMFEKIVTWFVNNWSSEEVDHTSAYVFVCELTPELFGVYVYTYGGTILKSTSYPTDYISAMRLAERWCWEFDAPIMTRQ